MVAASTSATVIAAATAWAGDCSATCPANFTGLCHGTCTGKCDGVPINVQAPLDAGELPDAATDDGGDDGSDAGPHDAGAPADAGGPTGAPRGPSYPHPPGGADGNCTGKCVGQCSSGADGDCKTPCLTFADGGAPYGNFQGGFCGAGDAPGLCTGTCLAADGVGTTLTCSGACTQYKKQCDGICRPSTGQGADAGGSACSVPLQNPYCEGVLSCQQNIECSNACQAFAQLSATCNEPEIVSVFAVSDPALYAAIKKFGGPLGKAVNHLATVRAAYSFIGNRTYGDFVNIGLSGDEALACTALGSDNATKTQALIQNASAADPTTAKY